MQKPNTDMHHIPQLVLVIWGGGNRPYFIIIIIQFFDPICQGKMENAGLGKALFRKSDFLKHLQGFAQVTCIPAFKHRFPQTRGVFQRWEKRKHAHGCPDKAKTAENRIHPNQTTWLAFRLRFGFKEFLRIAIGQIWRFRRSCE